MSFLDHEFADASPILAFSSPKAPAPLPTVPYVDPAQQAQAAQSADEQALAALGGGRASTVITGSLGDPNGAKGAVKTLLGQ